MVLHADVFPAVAAEPRPVAGEGKALDEDEVVGVFFPHGAVEAVVIVEVHPPAVAVRLAARLVEEVVPRHGALAPIVRGDGTPQRLRLGLVFGIAVQVEARVVARMVIHVLRAVRPVQVQHRVQAVLSAHGHRPVQPFEGIFPQGAVLFQIHIRKWDAHRVHAQPRHLAEVLFADIAAKVQLLQLFRLRRA